MHRFVFAIWSNTEETWKGQLIKNSSFMGLALYFSLLCINKNNSTKKFNDMCGKPWFFWMQNTRGDSIYPKLKGLNIHEKGLHLVSFVKNIYNSWKLITFSIYQYTVCHFFSIFESWSIKYWIAFPPWKLPSLRWAGTSNESRTIFSMYDIFSVYK